MTMAIRLKLERIIIKPIQTGIRVAILEFWPILTYRLHQNRPNSVKYHTLKIKITIFKSNNNNNLNKETQD
ncbi:hypothetical protein A142_12345 [Vibrio splendidus 12E03]|uniref:Uncharacterized protein n=1 Tax=Vibrio splendidus 12E03 TaxID=1191305 RepID=A0A1E5FBA5_VIBSP|nr:hypothetical protein A142_12345 [Vibrio splendidus 12E03]